MQTSVQKFVVSKMFFYVESLCCVHDKFFFKTLWIESSKDQHLFEIEIFCNIIKVFTVTFDQWIVSLLI